MEDNYNYNFTAEQTDYYEDEYVPEVRCPGKEIAGMITGIFSLFYSFLVIFCNTICLFALALAPTMKNDKDYIDLWVYGIVFILFAISASIASFVLYSKVKSQATNPTKKIKIGFIFGIIGCVVAVLNILVTLITIPISF